MKRIFRRGAQSMSWSLGDAESARGNINNLNLIRLVAAVSVVFGHAYPLVGIPDPTAVFFRNGHYIGDIAVDAFFVISGFLLTRSWQLNPAPVRFLTARILRLYPALIVCNALVIIVCWALVSHFRPSFLTAPQTIEFFETNSVILKPTIAYGLDGVFAHTTSPIVNGPLWTLPAEVRCYMIILGAGVVSLVLKHPKSFFPLLAIGLSIWAAMFQTAATIGTFDPFVRLFICFALGATMWIFRTFIPLNAVLAGTTLAIAATFARTSWYPSVAPLLYAYLVLFVGYGLPPASRSGWQTDISYGVYIYGWPIENGLVASGLHEPLAIFLGGLSMIVPVACASWFLIERPAIKFGRSLRRCRGVPSLDPIGNKFSDLVVGADDSQPTLNTATNPAPFTAIYRG